MPLAARNAYFRKAIGHLRLLPFWCATWHRCWKADKPRAVHYRAALAGSSLSGNGHPVTGAAGSVSIDTGPMGFNYADVSDANKAIAAVQGVERP